MSRDGDQEVKGYMDASGGYLPIGDYVLIGDCHGCALVAKTGRLDWCALGPFDADPVFCALLDRHRGGFLELQLGEALPRERAYVGETNILRSEFSTESARIEVVGMMIVGTTPIRSTTSRSQRPASS